jgi:hypothetical protein
VWHRPIAWNFVGPTTFQLRISRRPVQCISFVVGMLIVVGFLLWLAYTYTPMDGKIKNILNAVVVIAVVIYLLQIFGLLGAPENIKISHIT